MPATVEESTPPDMATTILVCFGLLAKPKELTVFDPKFSNKGFAIVYDVNSDLKKSVSKKIDERSMLIFQRNLKKGTFVKIKNLINGKSIIANVGENAIYPKFYNAVLSKRISLEIDLDLNQPYIEIQKIGIKGELWLK